MIDQLFLELVSRLETLSHTIEQRIPVFLSFARQNRTKTSRAVGSSSTNDRHPTALDFEAVGFMTAGHVKKTLEIIARRPSQPSLASKLLSFQA
jgi:hypothetical protein